jgi:hypothetical protein
MWLLSSLLKVLLWVLLLSGWSSLETLLSLASCCLPSSVVICVGHVLIVPSSFAALYCFLKVPFSQTIPSYWSCDSICLKQTHLLWGWFFVALWNAEQKNTSLFSVFSVTFYYRLSSRHLCIIFEYVIVQV